jgi:primosomal replication protein N
LTVSQKRRNEHGLRRLSFLLERQRLVVVVKELLRTQSASGIDLLQRLLKVERSQNPNPRAYQKLGWCGI